MPDDPSHNDARTAHLFQCGNTDLFAVSLDKTGASIPLADCGDGWRFRESFRLGVHKIMPIAVAPEPILRGMDNNGYFIWRRGSILEHRNRRLDLNAWRI
jgi:hypothetical protein